MNGSAAPVSGSGVSLRAFGSQAEFDLVTLRTQSPLRIELLPTGAVYALRYDTTLINQVLPGPAEDGIFRLLLREHASAELSATAPAPVRCVSLVGAGMRFTAGESFAAWRPAGDPLPGLEVAATLTLHPHLPAWFWRVSIRNRGETVRHIDAVLAHDLGLGDEAAVRNNEAYASQYIDFGPVDQAQLGWTLLARQNQPMAGGRHPWVGLICANGAEAFCTDGWQFFGADHRLTGEPSVARQPRLPSKRLQYECALAALQSRMVTLPAAGTAHIDFIARFVPDHPAPSAASDVETLRALLPELATPVTIAPPAEAPCVASLFTTAEWQHGEAPTEAALAAWFPGEHRQVERGADGRVLSFFCGEATHVVTRAKEAQVARPHGHILRSGDARWIDDAQFGLTAYAAGIFSAQSYLGNPSLARLLSVVRNALNVMRGAGQRIFVRGRDGWRQLGIPSAFAMTPADVRWIYAISGAVVEARVWCARAIPAAFLEVRVLAGEPREFLVSHQLALGGNEFECAGSGAVHPDQSWVSCLPGNEGFLAQHRRGVGFAIAAMAAPDAVIGGDEMLFTDGHRRHGPYVVVRVPASRRYGIAQLGTATGSAALPGLVAAARAAFEHNEDRAAAPKPIALSLRGGGVAAGRLREALPWFNHNAAIHFSAPHGLEQYGGGAWGVRDVCQGSLEWLLTAGDAATARRMLETVFAQQYYASAQPLAELTGTWPQWFMFPPFHAIQQAHSHGDVCLWPVKALCDYVEATNDLALLSKPVGYTDPRTFVPRGPDEPLWAHCDRVIAHVESRFVNGTALVNYGDGDWDDTLQPADASLRTRMISAWTVALAYQTFRQLAVICRRAGETARRERLDALAARMRADFALRLMPDGIVAGFLVTGSGTDDRPLLHPRDQLTGIRYRLLPMTRSVLAELFTPEEARRHLALIEQELVYPDGVRLMSRPAAYHGGAARLFRRAETAANVGREIGLQYVHAHLRYAEALAKVGEADGLWHALQVVNPVGLPAVLPSAAPRQSNVYFSSSDADFADRYEASARWNELRGGTVPVRGGWRLYSSGPGLFLRAIRTCLVGIRESFGDVVFDPVLPRALDGLVAEVTLAGMPAHVTYRVRHATHGPVSVAIGGVALRAVREPNPYRRGGLRVAGSEIAARLAAADNQVEVVL